MLFFKTPDVTVLAGDVVGLSKTGSSLNIHLSNNTVIKSTQIAAGWNLEAYTKQWQDLRVELEEKWKQNQALYNAPIKTKEQDETTPTDEAE